VKQLLITLLLALRGWKGIEITVYQSDNPSVSRADPRDDRDAYPFNP
jgi:hypothetical protein